MTYVRDQVYRLTVYDHTGLGGPMGTEQVSKIATDNFSTYQKAVNEFFRIYERNRGGILEVKCPEKPKLGEVYDFGSYGMGITKERVR